MHQRSQVISVKLRSRVGSSSVYIRAGRSSGSSQVNDRKIRDTLNYLIMKLIAAALCLATIAFARPQRGQYSGDLRNVPIVRYNFDGPNPDGSYQYDFETGNGIQHNEQGYLKAEDTQVKQGSFSYTGPDGVLYTINYIADENGFQAQGAHIPTPPPIPEAIQRSLEYNAAHPEPQRPGAPGGRFFRK